MLLWTILAGDFVEKSVLPDRSVVRIRGDWVDSIASCFAFRFYFSLILEFASCSREPTGTVEARDLTDYVVGLSLFLVDSFDLCSELLFFFMPGPYISFIGSAWPNIPLIGSYCILYFLELKLPVLTLLLLDPLLFLFYPGLDLIVFSFLTRSVFKPDSLGFCWFKLKLVTRLGLATSSLLPLAVENCRSAKLYFKVSWSPKLNILALWAPFGVELLLLIPCIPEMTWSKGRENLALFLS